MRLGVVIIVVVEVNGIGRRNRSVREIIDMLVGQVWSRMGLRPGVVGVGRMFPTLLHSLRHGPLCKAVSDQKEEEGGGWSIGWSGKVSRRRRAALERVLAGQ